MRILGKSGTVNRESDNENRRLQMRSGPSAFEHDGGMRNGVAIHIGYSSHNDSRLRLWRFRQQALLHLSLGSC